jgi:hydrogenase-1 operon protein HyaE
MPSQMLRNMIEKHGYPVLDQNALDAFARERDAVVLFFAGNPLQFPESDDVAVVLPELLKAFGGRLQAALIERKAETALQSRYGFGTWPALVFLRRGQYLGVITQVRNWDEYLLEIERLLASQPVKAPGFKVPVVSEPVQAPL